MTEPRQASNGIQEVESVVLKTVGERPLEADQIWDELEARGIRATPGVIHLALIELARSAGTPAEDGADGPPPEHGLTRRDLKVIADLAEKVGGVEKLRRLLKLVEAIPKASDS
jgi:hypothetical protein